MCRSPEGNVLHTGVNLIPEYSLPKLLTNHSLRLSSTMISLALCFHCMQIQFSSFLCFTLLGRNIGRAFIQHSTPCHLFQPGMLVSIRFDALPLCSRDSFVRGMG